jgi:hypothetical protein
MEPRLPDREDPAKAVLEATCTRCRAHLLVSARVPAGSAKRQRFLVWCPSCRSEVALYLQGPDPATPPVVVGFSRRKPGKAG